jgi:hypothetical protein
MPKDDDLSKRRDEVIKRMIATPPKAHKDEPSRKPKPTPIGTLIAKASANKKRDKA